MANSERFIPAEVLAEPLARANRLAERMARVLKDEDVSDAMVAIALLTSGVVHHYADGRTKADELTNTIRKLGDGFLAKAMGAGDLKLQ